jgi:hypothetical protein
MLVLTGNLSSGLVLVTEHFNQVKGREVHNPE